MANFSTEFPINSESSIEDVVQLACKWIAGSPHSKFKNRNFSELPKNSEKIFSIENEQVTIATAYDIDHEIGGLRYSFTDQGLEWITSIVSSKTKEKHLLSIQVSCEALNTTAKLPPPKKPYFIRQALTKLKGGMDGEIPVTEKPFRLGENESIVAAELINGVANNKLPIIYISSGFNEQPLVNPDEIAKLVSGMAHVVVEPSRKFSFKVKNLTNSRNVFGGAIGIYWPESKAKNTYFPDDSPQGPRAVQLNIAKDIRLALSNRRIRTNCTWANLKEAITRKRYDLLKLEGSTELQAYIDAFDEDQAAKDAKLSEAEQEILRLNAELRRLTLSSNSSSQGIIKSGKEQDLYEKEISDTIIEAFKEALRHTRENSRRQHILTDIIEANHDTGEKEKLENEIKSIFKTYRDMDARTKSALIKIGFDITEDGKHYKAVFQNDSRYTFAIPKTSSDHRSGKNTASDINSILF